MTANIVYAVIALILSAVAIFILREPKPTFDSEKLNGRVRHVVDGDSLYINSHEKQIRLWGVNAPDDGEPGFEAATKFLTRLAKGKRINCQVMHVDKYGRTVGRCYLSDGRDIGAVMIENRHAVEVRGFSKGYYENIK